jgi:hypothetical protein
MVAAAAALLLVWQLFLQQRFGLPEQTNFWITFGLCALCGVLAIVGISMTLLESIMLEESQVHIRNAFGRTVTHSYDEISSISPEGDKVLVIFADGRRLKVRNLKLGTGVLMSRLGTVVEEKARPKLSIFGDPED